MQESTIWTAIERNDKNLNSLFDSLKNAYESKRTIHLKEEEDYLYAIHETAGKYMQDKFWKEASLYGIESSPFFSVSKTIKGPILSSFYEKEDGRE